MTPTDTAPDEAARSLFELAHDEVLWQNTPFSTTLRGEILKKLAEGQVAIALEDLKINTEWSNQVFCKKKLGGMDYLIPHRYKRMLDFFCRRPMAIKTAHQTDAIAHLLTEDANFLLTGGPGTGKSHQITALLKLLGEKKSTRPLRVTIAAPTGKAVARFAHLQTSQGVLLEWATVHRLLGITSEFSFPRFNALYPLGVDLLIVDEISMLNLGLFTALIDALPEHARVVLAGDTAQLPAVEGLPIEHCLNFLERCQLINRIHLKKVYRFSHERSNTYQSIADSGLAAIREESEGVSLLWAKNFLELRHLVVEHTAARFTTKEAEALRQKLKREFDPQTPDLALLRNALNYLQKEIVLTTRREGALGSAQINRLIAERVGESTSDRTLMPIIATVNNYRLRIFNGDTGFIICHHEREYAVMQTSGGEIAVIALALLDNWQAAYAITVHKSQGSEYDEVWVIFEENVNQLANDHRLLYTAVTRARNHAHIVALPAPAARPAGGEAQ